MCSIIHNCYKIFDYINRFFTLKCLSLLTCIHLPYEQKWLESIIRFIKTTKRNSFEYITENTIGYGGLKSLFLLTLLLRHVKSFNITSMNNAMVDAVDFEINRQFKIFHFRG
ncbi:putative oxidoreductase [Dirofilaria immitis]